LGDGGGGRSGCGHACARARVSAAKPEVQHANPCHDTRTPATEDYLSLSLRSIHALLRQHPLPHNILTRARPSSHNTCTLSHTPHARIPHACTSHAPHIRTHNSVVFEKHNRNSFMFSLRTPRAHNAWTPRRTHGHALTPRTHAHAHTRSHTLTHAHTRTHTHTHAHRHPALSRPAHLVA
jgi:hypothetical protein